MIRDVILGMLAAIVSFVLIGYCQASDEAAIKRDRMVIAENARAAAHPDRWHLIAKPTNNPSFSAGE